MPMVVGKSNWECFHVSLMVMGVMQTKFVPSAAALQLQKSEKAEDIVNVGQ